MSKDFKIGDEVWVKGVINSEIRNSGVHVLHSGIDAFYPLELVTDLRPTVSKGVAEWYEEHKAWVHDCLVSKEYIDDLAWDASNQNLSLLDIVRMDEFGYKIETSLLYKVIIPNVKKSRSCLVYNLGEQKWYFKSRNTKGGAFRINHTREQLEEAGFGWVFDCGFAQEEEE